MARFKVKFANVEDGWVQTIFNVGEKKYEHCFSYVYGSSFPSLCVALRSLVDENWAQVIIWMAEPEEYEMRFSKQDDEIKFEMWQFNSSSRNIKYLPTLEFSISGNYDEICLPFWRALRALQAFYSEAECQSRWRYEFPTRELKELTDALGK